MRDGLRISEDNLRRPKRCRNAEDGSKLFGPCLVYGPRVKVVGDKVTDAEEPAWTRRAGQGRLAGGLATRLDVAVRKVNGHENGSHLPEWQRPYNVARDDHGTR